MEETEQPDLAVGELTTSAGRLKLLVGHWSYEVPCLPKTLIAGRRLATTLQGQTSSLRTS